MATVYIAEYDHIGVGSFGRLPMVKAPPIAEQTVAITAGSVQSAAFNARTQIIRVHADAICSIKVGGTGPVATATVARFAAGQTEYFAVNPLDKLAVITNS